MILRGDVYWVDHRGAVGAEIQKIRPAVVISSDEHNAFRGTVTVAPLSSGSAKAWIEVAVPKGAFGDGRAARIKTDQLRAVDKSRIGKRMGRLPDAVLAALDDSLRLHLAIES